ncbi:hypothetical protein X947_6079 [Burkholderia pseudomallei MSHR7334]|uniref:hypothetical protein n=1 Tax=Burkholderia pseudomallei TaxID=28450 RepID=UPI000530D63F|nr:hypothetical protein [Burkholderia pseudomallei]KGS89851.1 hypothetical protein X947_6079 [Burkholderia pseudomallei MSHR7334]
MSDSYQAIYDATRSRIHGGDVGQAVETAVRDAFGNAEHVIHCAMQDASASFSEYGRPSAVYRPTLGIDGNKWRALYGPNLMEGVCGFGDSPAEAMADFDKNWLAKIPTA